MKLRVKHEWAPLARRRKYDIVNEFGEIVEGGFFSLRSAEEALDEILLEQQMANDIVKLHEEGQK
jgi:hypothetical protein